MKQGSLHHFLQLFYLFFAATNIIICDIWFFLHLSGQSGHDLLALLSHDIIELTCIMVTVGSILGGSGRWISYLLRSPTLKGIKSPDANDCRKEASKFLSFHLYSIEIM